MKTILCTILIVVLTTPLFSQGIIIEIKPNSSKQNKTLMVSIVGLGTQWKTGSSTVQRIAFRHSQVSNSVIWGTNITTIDNENCNALFTISSNTLIGSYNVEVFYNWGLNSNVEQNGFTVTGAGGNNPEITTVTPSSGVVGQQNLKVSIAGKNTHFNAASTTVVLVRTGGSATTIYPSNYGFSTPTLLESFFNIPSSTSVIGNWTVTVSNAIDGLLKKVNGFTITGSSTVPSIVLDNKEKGDDFNLYPVPAKNKLHLAFNWKVSSTIAISIFNMKGEKVLNSAPFGLQPGMTTTELDVSHLNGGNYILEVRSENKKISKQFIKY